MQVHDLAPAPGATKNAKRVGRGTGGKGGKTAGRGSKGQRARNTVARGFEGGQTPLKQRVPKLKGFNNPFRVEYQAVNLHAISALVDKTGDTTVTPEVLVTNGVVRNAVNVPSVSGELLEQIRPYLALAEKLGRFQGQLCPGSIEEIEIEYAGDVADLRVAPITIAVLKGLLESVSDRVNMVNAPVIAQERGIRVVESKTRRSRDFASGITTRVRGGTDRLIEGALFHGNQPRIVRIDDFMLEAIPEGSTILIHNHDQPGVVGMVGNLLGEAGINISRMQLALVRERSEAAMLVNVDQSPSDATMEKLRSQQHVITAQLVEL